MLKQAVRSRSRGSQSVFNWPLVGVPTVLLLTAALLSGCAGRIPETRYYLLSEPQQALVSATERAADTADSAPAAVAAEATALRLLAVRVPDYLQTRGLVVALEDSRIQAATYHQWAEPLVAGLERYLGAALASATADAEAAGPAALLMVSLNHLHGSEAGRVVLDAEWKLLSAQDRGVLGEGRLERELAQDQPGYAALVAAHRRLLDGLAAEIVAAWGVVPVPAAAAW